MIEYGIAAGETHFQLDDQVNEQCAEGWVPNGNVFQYQYGDQPLLCQPMIRAGKIKKKTRIQSTNKK